MSVKECLELLELKNGATFAEVKISYRELLRIWHPDRYQHDKKLAERALGKTKLLNLAYETLSAISQKPEYVFRYENAERQQSSGATQQGSTNHRSESKPATPKESGSPFLARRYAGIALVLIIGLILLNNRQVLISNPDLLPSLALTPFMISYVPNHPLPELSPQKLVELEDLLNFLLPEKDAGVGDWYDSAVSESPIAWQSNGLDDVPVDRSEVGENARSGIAAISVNGRLTNQHLGRSLELGSWTVDITGSKFGYSAVFIKSLDPVVLDVDFTVAKYLSSRGWHVEHFRCGRETVFNGITSIHRVLSPKGYVLWIQEAQHGGSSGANEEITLFFDESLANKTGCEV